MAILFEHLLVRSTLNVLLLIYIKFFKIMILPVDIICEHSVSQTHSTYQIWYYLQQHMSPLSFEWQSGKFGKFWQSFHMISVLTWRIEQVRGSQKPALDIIKYYPRPKRQSTWIRKFGKFWPFFHTILVLHALSWNVRVSQKPTLDIIKYCPRPQRRLLELLSKCLPIATKWCWEGSRIKSSAWSASGLAELTRLWISSLEREQASSCLEDARLLIYKYQINRASLQWG
jgi:hypothetical protein